MSVNLAGNLLNVIVQRHQPTTEAGLRLQETKHVLSGLDREGAHAARVLQNSQFTHGSSERDGVFRRGALDLAYNTPAFPSSEGGLMRYSPGVALAGIKALNNPHAFPINRYPADDVSAELIQLCRTFFRKECGLDQVGYENISLGVGSTQLVDAVLSTFLTRRTYAYDGDTCLGEVLGNAGTDGNGLTIAGPDGATNRRANTGVHFETAPDIVLSGVDEYHSYARFPEKWGGEMANVQQFTYEGLTKWWEENPDVRRRVRMLMFSNPKPSSGHVMTRGELEGVARFAQEKNLFVLADEIYRMSVLEPDKTPMLSIASLPGMAERTATTYSLSKDYGMADVRLGWMAAPKEVTDAAISYSLYTVTTISFIQQLMAAQGLREILDIEPGNILPENNAELKKRRDLILGNIREINDAVNTKLENERPELFERLNSLAKARREKELEEGRITADELSAMQESGRYLKPISVSTRCDAAHSLVMDMEDLVAGGVVLVDGRKLKDSLDVAGLLMDFGVPVSPMHSTGSPDTRTRFVFGQFGDDAFHVFNMRELMKAQAKLYSQAFAKDIKPDTSDAALTRYARTFGMHIKPELLSIQTADDAYAYGRAKLDGAMKHIGHAVEDLLMQQDSYQMLSSSGFSGTGRGRGGIARGGG